MLTHGQIMFYMVMVVQHPSLAPNFDRARCLDAVANTYLGLEAVVMGF